MKKRQKKSPKKFPGKFITIGLTGGIGMGKSKAAEILSRFGLPIYSADAAVHRLIARNGAAVLKIARLFPGAVKKGAVDRAALGRHVFGKPKELKKLEAILHPLVRKEETLFLQGAHRAGARAAVLEIPLLFETGGEKRCDIVLCVTAPKNIQMKRVMQRPGMDAAKFRAIVKMQMPDLEKRRRADYIVDTGKSMADTQRQLKRILASQGLI